MTCDVELAVDVVVAFLFFFLWREARLVRSWQLPLPLQFAGLSTTTVHCFMTTAFERLRFAGVFCYAFDVKEPGLDQRHRDKDGEIDRKHRNTRVDSLRKTYGDDFLPDWRGDAHLGTVLDDTGADSLSELVKKYRKK